MRLKPLVVAITGASGSIYGIELLKVLKRLNHPTHLILSHAGAQTLELETNYSCQKIYTLADQVYDENDITSPLASGSYLVSGMAVIPCSIKTLSAITNSYNHNLLVRTADVQLKEQRPLVLMVRETPLHRGHLKLMIQATSLGIIILPPMPAFYHKPKNIIDIIHQSIGKILDQFHIPHNLFKRWQGSHYYKI